MKKLTSIILVLMLVLALLPLGALAQESEETVYSAEQGDTLLAESDTNEPVEEASEPTEEATEEVTEEATETAEEATEETIEEATKEASDTAPETASLALDGTGTDTSNRCGENLTWTLENGTLTISGTGAMADYISGKETPWYTSRASITSVVIGSGVTSVGSYAFAGCSSLVQVTISEGVTSMGECAFLRCALTSVTLPNSLTTIGEAAFSGNRALTSITIPAGVTQLPKNAFSACTALTNINVAEGNQSYSSNGGVVFSKDGETLRLYPYGKSELVYTIPDGVTSIEDKAFPGSQRLAALVIPTSVTSIEDLPLSTNIYYAGTEAQWNAVDMDETLRACLGTVDFESDAPSGDVVVSGSCGVGVKWAFSNDGKLTISGSGAMADYQYDNSAPWNAFLNSITSVEVESGVTHIGARAFISCGAVTSATIAGTVTSIGNNAFCYCYSLESLTLPSSVTSIGNAAFKECMALTSVTLPSGVTSIGSETFDYCTALEGVTIGSGVTSIAQDAFTDCHALASITVDDANKNYSSRDGVLFNKGGTTLVRYPEGKAGTSYTVPSGVTTIWGGAFRDSKLTSITLPSSLTSIGEYAFESCESLTSVNFPSSLTSLGEGAFYHCYKLPSVTIPSGITSIENYTFYGCNRLVSVTIPASVTSIGDGVFCDWPFEDSVPLADVYYAGTAADWEKISMGESNDRLTGVTLHYKTTPTTDDGTKPAAKTTDAKKPPRTGDESHTALWLAVALLGGCAVVGTTVIAKKKNYTR